MNKVRIRHRFNVERWRVSCLVHLAAAPTVGSIPARIGLARSLAALYLRDILHLPPANERRVDLGTLGSFWVYDVTEVLVLWQVLMDECYEHAQLPASADVIIDLGCNVGATLTWLHRRYPEATIIGLEADPRTASLARRNTEGVAGVEVHHLAIGPTSGTVTLRRDPQKSWSASIEKVDGDAIDVPSISLDDLLDRYRIERLGLLKIDVEGAEHASFEASQRLGDVDTIIGEFHPLPERDWTQFCSTLDGFAVEQIALPTGGLIDFIATRNEA